MQRSRQHSEETVRTDKSLLEIYDSSFFCSFARFFRCFMYSFFCFLFSLFVWMHAKLVQLYFCCRLLIFADDTSLFFSLKMRRHLEKTLWCNLCFQGALSTGVNQTANNQSEQRKVSGTVGLSGLGFLEKGLNGRPARPTFLSKSNMPLREIWNTFHARFVLLYVYKCINQT